MHLLWELTIICSIFQYREVLGSKFPCFSCTWILLLNHTFVNITVQCELILRVHCVYEYHGETNLLNISIKGMPTDIWQSWFNTHTHTNLCMQAEKHTHMHTYTHMHTHTSTHALSLCHSLGCSLILSLGHLLVRWLSLSHSHAHSFGHSLVLSLSLLLASVLTFSLALSRSLTLACSLSLSHSRLLICSCSLTFSHRSTRAMG